MRAKAFIPNPAAETSSSMDIGTNTRIMNVAVGLHLHKVVEHPIESVRINNLGSS